MVTPASPGERPEARSTTVMRDELGLLDAIADGALDDDYYEVRPGRYSRGRGFSTAVTAVTLMVFALLVTTAAVQTRTLRPAAQADRSTLVADIQRGEKSLADRQETQKQLTAEIARLENRSARANPALRRLRVLSGAVAVQGEGIGVVVTPRPSTSVDVSAQVGATDLSSIVNVLWSAGAEAVSVNGQRLTSLSSIHKTGTAIAVNYRSISPPYVVLALGNAVMLDQRLRTSRQGSALLDALAERDLRVDIEKYDMIDLRAAPERRVATLNATVLKEKR